MTNIKIDMEKIVSDNTTIEGCPICITGIEIETKEQLESLIRTDFFNQLIGRIYWFMIFVLLINFYTYHKLLKHYLKFEKKIKILFVIQLFLQMSIYIYITYVKFLIFYNYWDLGIFFIILLPFFYIINIYSYPLSDKYIDRIIKNLKKKNKEE